MTLRTALVAAVVALSLPVLAACGGSDDDASDPAATASAQASQRAAAARRDAGLADFVADYRKDVPKSAKGLTDARIRGVAIHVCEYTKDTKAKRPAVMDRLSKEMQANGVRPNDAAVTKLARLAVKDVCPAQKDALEKLL
jgi:hypothetical protein